MEEEEIGELKEDEEMENCVNQGKEIMNENSTFVFHIPRLQIPIRKAISKLPRTPTRISNDPKFMKRLINNLLFMPEPPEQKNPRASRIDESLVLGQILSKFDTLSQTVETQIKHICVLEKQVEELTTQARGNIQANKASRATTKKIKTMAKMAAAMAATSTT